MIFKKKEKREKFYLMAIRFPINNREDARQFLINLFEDVRPTRSSSHEEAEQNLLNLITYLEHNTGLTIKLQQAILRVFDDAELETAFSKGGIPMAGGFWGEFNKRVKHKIIPEVESGKDFGIIIGEVFYKRSDHNWVELIDRSTWVHFFDLLQFPLQATNDRLREHVLSAMTLLSYQIASAGLENEIANYLPKEVMASSNKFLTQNFKLLELKQQMQLAPANVSHAFEELRNDLFDLQKAIQSIRDNESLKGTSIRQSYLLMILTYRVRRMLILLDIIDGDSKFDSDRFLTFFRLVVRNENTKNSVRELVSQAVGYVAYQIAELKGKRGTKYITHDRATYNKMLRSAMGGGLIVSFIAVIKNLLSNLHIAYFWQGFWYSVNYSLGFIAIDQSGSTLATKQPAFTANAIACSLDAKKNEGKANLENLAVTVASVFRSQTASFVGNLIIVFPGTYLLAWAYDKLFGHKIAEGITALQLLESQHPFHSLSLLYAVNTGIFLFLSGIIAGYVQNKIRFSNLKDRIVSSGKSKRNFKSKVGIYLDKYGGAYAGNISLGFFLGMSGTLGKFFGIPFDIRHITISAGNMAIGVYGLGIQNIPLKYMLTVLLGVLSIGFINFLVSFSLSFFIAIKSRGILLHQYPELLQVLAKQLLTKPLSFIIPPKIKAID